MQPILKNTIYQERLLFIFICFHVIAWTLTPILFRTTLPMDAIEGSIWGQHLSWGYDKNPFLNASLSRFANELDHYRGWVIYLFSQLSVAICFWFTFKLAKEILSANKALFAVLILEIIQYYNLHAIDFNDNTLELSLWSIITYYFYRGLRTSNYVAWLITGVFAGLGIMAKYYTLLLLFCMFLFLLCNKNLRAHFKMIGPYAALLCCLLIITPHFLWLFSHDFITVRYVFLRTITVPDWRNHIFYPSQFAIQQLITFLPALVFLLFTTFLSDKDIKQTTTSFDKRFLIFVGLGPFIFTILLSVVFGIKLRAGWGEPLESLWAVIFLALMPMNITRKQIKYIFTMMIVLMFTTIAGYVYRIRSNVVISSANFPGPAITLAAEKLWYDRYHQPLHYVAGPRELSGIVSYYSKDHPNVWMDWNSKKSFWIDINDLKTKGGIFIWNLSTGDTLPTTVQRNFKQLSKVEIRQFNWLGETSHPPIKIAMSLLPPKNSKD